MKVKGPVTAVPPRPSDVPANDSHEASETTKPSEAASPATVAQQASMQAEWERLQRLRKQSLQRNLTGAANLFSDGVYFPANLLDTEDPKNDANYLRLLAAVLNFSELDEPDDPDSAE